MCPLFFTARLLVYDCCGHMLLTCSAMSVHTSMVLVLRVQTDPSLTFGRVQGLLTFFKASLIGPEREMRSMSCCFTCFSQHYAIIRWTVPDLLALQAFCPTFTLASIQQAPEAAASTCNEHIQASFSSLVKHNDFALFIYGTSDSPVYI